MKRVFTFFCALCLLTSCLIVMPMEVEATAVSQASAVSWAKNQIGKGLDYDGAYGNQCVDLIYYYYKYLGVSPVGGNANAYISNALPAGWKRISSNVVPQPGDIAVFKTNYGEWTGQYGHVGIALSGTSGKFSIIHQNYSGRKYCSQTDNLPTDLLACVIRPNFGSTELSVAWKDYPEKHSVGTTNAVLAARCDLNVDISAVSQVGIYLYDGAGNTLKSKMERANISGYTYFYVWYDVNSALGYTLSPGTTYKYKFVAVVSGKTYYGPVREFKTGGHSHSYSEKITEEPTCTANGTKIYTCSCGKSYSETIPATGHTYASATCTKPKTCKVCKATSGEALGHSYKSGSCTRCKHTPTGVKIKIQPKSVKVAPGQNAKVSVKASGDGLTYTWYYMKKGTSAYKKSGNQTTNTHAVKMSSGWNGAKVYCVVKDKYGNSVKSSVATLYMGNPAKITVQPKMAVVSKNKTAKVTVKASGDGLTYTWYYAQKGASKYTKSSVTKNTFSVNMASKWNNCKVYCVVKDKYGNSVKTEVVKLYMGKPAKITTQPKSVSVKNGKTAKVTVKASGDGLTYTWYYQLKGATKYTKSSITKNVFSAKMATKWHGAQVYCVVKDKYGTTVKTTVVKLSMSNAAKITTQPKSTTVANGKTAKVTVKASGDGLKYTWYYQLKGNTKWVKATVTKNVFSQKMAAKWNGCKVYCVVKDKYGTTVKSNVVALKLK